MATGHPSFGTFHAESANSVIKRLMMPPINLSPAMIEALDALCIITPARVGGKEVRRISEIDELVSVTEKGDVTINVPFIRDPAKDTFLFKTGSKVFEKIMKRTGLTWKELSKEFENRTRLLMEMYRRKIFGFAEVQDIIHEYSKSTGTGLEEVWFVKVNDNMAKSTPITASCRALRLCSYLYLNLASFHLDKVFQLPMFNTFYRFTAACRSTSMG